MRTAKAARVKIKAKQGKCCDQGRWVVTRTYAFPVPHESDLDLDHIIALANSNCQTECRA
jgi:hypothetical protein